MTYKCDLFEMNHLSLFQKLKACLYCSIIRVTGLHLLNFIQSGIIIVKTSSYSEGVYDVD